MSPFRELSRGCCPQRAGRLARSRRQKPFCTRMQVVPDCLILDLWLPGMTGVELLEHLAAKGSLLPAIIMTARDDPQMHMRALQVGVVAYFLKPLEGPEPCRQSRTP